jgi:RNA polymerase sigma-70 factor, ECF subfamily
MPEPNQEWMAERFQEQRPRLLAAARRMLGSEAEAEDAVQEAWLRLARAEAASIHNLGGWLTTVVARVCLDQLRRRKVRGEESVAENGLPETDPGELPGPEKELLLAESVQQALQLVLDRLAPAERVAFVLHDLFDLPFVDVAAVLERSEENARQLASRARQRVRLGRARPAGAVDSRAVVEAFLAASRRGDFEALLTLLDPGVVLRADTLAVRTAAANRTLGAPVLEPELRGPQAVAGAFSGRSHGARLALLDGAPGGVWIHEGALRSAFAFTVSQGRITTLRVVMQPDELKALRVQML